jgi:pimeloyl-ACP methyl ester carboxylesterase
MEPGLPVEVTKEDVLVDGRRWHFIQAGDPGSEPLLLIHGFRSSSRFFKPVMRALADRWWITAPDLPGHGDSQRWDPSEDVVEQWVLLEAFLREVDLAPTAMLGNSRGAAVALQVAAHRPKLVTALVLIAAPTHPFTPGTLDVRQMVVNKDILTPDTLREMGRTMMASRTYESARRRAVESDVLERDLRPIMADVTAPTLVIWGSDDRTIPIEMGRQLIDGIKGARLEIIEGSGHLPMLERPKVTLPLIRHFLEDTNVDH